MNLHNIVAPVVAAVNPAVLATIQRSTGYTTNDDGSRVPSYDPPTPILAQKQALQYNDLVMVDGINLTGVRCAMYLNGNWDGIVRADGKGGDLITLPNGSIWLVVIVAEDWAEQDGWVKVICTQQVA